MSVRGLGDSVALVDAQYEWNPVGVPYVTGPPGDCLVYSRAAFLRACETNGDPLRGRYAFSGGACYADRGRMSKWQRIALMLVDFQKMVVRDGLDPAVVHREFLKIREYRLVIPLDCPGAEDEQAAS